MEISSLRKSSTVNRLALSDVQFPARQALPDASTVTSATTSIDASAVGDWESREPSTSSDVVCSETICPFLTGVPGISAWATYSSLEPTDPASRAYSSSSPARPELERMASAPVVVSIVLVRFLAGALPHLSPIKGISLQASHATRAGLGYVKLVVPPTNPPKSSEPFHSGPINTVSARRAASPGPHALCLVSVSRTIPA